MKGFSLIELILIVSIILILSSILIVNFQGGITSTEDVKKELAVRSLEVPAKQYYAQKGEYTDICTKNESFKRVIDELDLTVGGGQDCRARSTDSRFYIKIKREIDDEFFCLNGLEEKVVYHGPVPICNITIPSITP